MPNIVEEVTAEERDRVKHQEDELQSDVPDYLNPHRMHEVLGGEQ